MSLSGRARRNGADIDRGDEGYGDGRSGRRRDAGYELVDEDDGEGIGGDLADTSMEAERNGERLHDRQGGSVPPKTSARGQHLERKEYRTL